TEMPIGKISACSDGKIGWIVTPQGGGALGGPQLKQVQGDLFRNYFRLLTADRLGYQVTRAADDALEFRDNTGQSAVMHLNPSTGLPRLLSYEGVNVSGPIVTVEEEYSDFRSVDGIQVPFKVTITQGGRTFASVTVQEYKVNTGLKLEDLSVRPR